VTNPVLRTATEVTAATSGALSSLAMAQQAGDLNAAAQIIGPLMGILSTVSSSSSGSSGSGGSGSSGSGGAGGNEAPAVSSAQLQEIRSSALSIAIAISNASAVQTTSSLSQTAMMVSSIVFT
jgi:hypothetical protein